MTGEGKGEERWKREISRDRASTGMEEAGERQWAIKDKTEKIKQNRELEGNRDRKKQMTNQRKTSWWGCAETSNGLLSKHVEGGDTLRLENISLLCFMLILYNTWHLCLLAKHF